MRKQSSSTEVAVYPKPIERQNVSTCLKVFCDRTLAALRSHSGIDQNDAAGTNIFIEKIMSFWKIVSNQEIYGDQRLKDPLKKPIMSHENHNLHFLAEIAIMADQLYGRHGKSVKSLTRDTSLALSLSHTCRCLIDMCNALLQSTNKHVLLGEFTTDYLEGSGGTYFITVQNVIKKLHIE